jgi:hypothetical protein
MRTSMKWAEFPSRRRPVLKWLFAGALFLGLFAGPAFAETLQDWSALDRAKDMGVFFDPNGSSVAAGLDEGPTKAQKAFRIASELKDWGGAWARMRTDLTGVSAVRFQARSESPGLLRVVLGDDQKARYVTVIRVVSDEWQWFTLPLSSFAPTPYAFPQAPRTSTFHWSKVEEIQFQPETLGSSNFIVGPVSALRGRAKAYTGMPENGPGSLVVQDFILLEKNAYGPFTDEKSGSEITLALKQDPEGKVGHFADFRYDLKAGGWCGYWIRAGQLWGGQDWTGGKALRCRVLSREPITLQFGFNDANQNAYVATAPPTAGTGWQTVEVPLGNFQLNPYYQPTEAQKGQPLDLSHIESFNIAPVTKGEHDFQVSRVGIQK